MKLWGKEKRDYKIVNEFMKEKLIQLIIKAGIKADVSARVKKELSLKRKLIRKGNNDGAYNSIIDKSSKFKLYFSKFWIINNISLNFIPIYI